MLNLRLGALSFALRIEFLDGWIPHDVRHAVFASVSRCIRIVRQAVIKITDLSKLLCNGFRRRHSFFMWEIHTPCTLPSSCGKPAGSRFVEHAMIGLRTVFAAEYYNERRDVFWLQGLNFRLRPDGASHVCACTRSDCVDQYVVLLPFARE